jgi:hypothetical protein
VLYHLSKVPTLLTVFSFKELSAWLTQRLTLWPVLSIQIKFNIVVPKRWQPRLVREQQKDSWPPAPNVKSENVRKSIRLGFFFFFFWWDWDFNSVLHSCKAGTLPLETHLTTKFRLLAALHPLYYPAVTDGTLVVKLPGRKQIIDFKHSIWDYSLQPPVINIPWFTRLAPGCWTWGCF